MVCPHASKPSSCSSSSSSLLSSHKPNYCLLYLRQLCYYSCYIHIIAQCHEILFFSKFSQIFHICMFPPIIGLFCTYFLHSPYFSTIAFTMFITIRNILWFQRKYLSWAQKRGSVSLLGLPFYSVQQQKVNFYLICEAPQWAASRNSTQT